MFDNHIQTFGHRRGCYAMFLKIRMTKTKKKEEVFLQVKASFLNIHTKMILLVGKKESIKLGKGNI